MRERALFSLLAAASLVLLFSSYPFFVSQGISRPAFLLLATTIANIPPKNKQPQRAASKNDGRIMIEQFDNPIHEWKEMNDPVMGGRSTGSFSIQTDTGTALFQGQVVNVPFLHAPGFIQSRTIDRQPYPDISSCQAIELRLRSLTNYSGYRFSFGDTHAPGGKFFARGYKVTLPPDISDEFTTVTLPLDMFTDFWDDATGDPIHTCQENSLYCPDAATLQNMRTMAIWGEGVIGTVALELRTIAAVGCAAVETKKQ